MAGKAIVGRFGSKMGQSWQTTQKYCGLGNPIISAKQI
jgi:hypothetical protein